MLTRISPASGFSCPGGGRLQEYSRSHTPLLSVESQRPLTDIAAVAFSLSFEPDYLNVLNLLAGAGIPFWPPNGAETSPAWPRGVWPPCSTPNPWPPSWTPFFWGRASPAAEPLFRVSGRGRPRPRIGPPCYKPGREHPRRSTSRGYRPDYNRDGTLSLLRPPRGFRQR